MTFRAILLDSDHRPSLIHTGEAETMDQAQDQVQAWIDTFADGTRLGPDRSPLFFETEFYGPFEWQ